MFRKPPFCISLVLFLTALPALSGCAMFLQPAPTSGQAPAPIISIEKGRIQSYQNDALGFRLNVPEGFQLPDANVNNVLILGPGEGHPTDNRVGVFITVEPANGQTAEQVATQLAKKTKAEMGNGYTGGDVTAMDIDGEPAFSVSQLPGQDINRQLFIVHGNLLYKMMFVPDSPQAPAYRQMQDGYVEIVNTFHFTK